MNTVASLNTSFDHYIRHGWSLVPIPPGTKGPRQQGWNRKENALPLGSHLPEGYGVGLSHAYSGTMSLDIDHWDNAVALLADQGIDLPALYNSLDAVTIESGVKGHGKLLYQMPFGMVLPSKKIQVDGVVAFELRCSTNNGLTVQDVLPPSIHPETLRPYQWGGKGQWQRLPTCPIEILTYWDNLVQSDNVRNIRLVGHANTSWDEIRSALASISPDCAREQWIQIGMALHNAGTTLGDPDAGCAIWDEWSAGSIVKYKGPRDIEACWRSFHANDGITIGTLFHYARLSGWTRAMADASVLFSAVEPTPPKLIAAHRRPPPPDVDLSLWPDVLVARANEISQARGCDPLVPLMAGLAAVCGAADSRIRLELMYEFEVPPILWVMTIGNPADKKTPGSAPMFKPLEMLQIEDADRYKAELKIWEGMEARHAAAKKDWLVKAANPLEDIGNDVVAMVPDLPPQPQPLSILVADISSQMLVRKSANNKRGLLCALDEMAGWVNKVSDPRSGDDRSTWTRGYEGGMYQYDRVSAGSITVEQFALSMYGNMQPKVLQKVTSQLEIDGLLQRFIPVCLRDHFVRKGEPVAAWMSCASAYEQLIRRTFALPSRKYTLSDGAFRAYRAFQDWYYALRKDEILIQSTDAYLTALGKIEGTCGRLALVFHLIDNPYEGEVSEATMRQAIRVCQEYIVPSFRYVHNTWLNDDSFEQWIQDHIIYHSGEVEKLSLSEIRRSAKQQIKKMNMRPDAADSEIRTCMDWLQVNNWVSLIEETRRGATWQINPMIASTYASERQAIIEARQRTRDKFIAGAAYKGTLRPETSRKVPYSR